jgi:hypothetical protein
MSATLVGVGVVAVVLTLGMFALVERVVGGVEVDG